MLSNYDSDLLGELEHTILSNQGVPDIELLETILYLNQFYANKENISPKQQQKFQDFKNNVSTHLIEVVRKKLDSNTDSLIALQIIKDLQAIGIEAVLDIYHNSTVISGIKQMYPAYFDDSKHAAKNFTPLASQQDQAYSSSTLNRQSVTASNYQNFTPSDILQQFEKMLGVERYDQGYRIDPTIEANIITKLEQLKSQDQKKFKQVIELRSMQFEQNTLLLTALSLETLELAKYLLQQQANINVRNEFGIDPINMLAMVHVDCAKVANTNSATSLVDDLQISSKIDNIKQLLQLMQSSDPIYFQQHMNQPRKYHDHTGSSIPLTKVIAYCQNPNILPIIIKLWRDFGANAQSIIAPVGSYAIGKSPEFVKKLEEIFPGTFSPDNLKKKYKSDTTILQELMRSENPENALAWIKTVQAINCQQPDRLEQQLKIVGSNKTLQSLRTILLLYLNNNNISDVISEPTNILQSITKHNDWWKFLMEHDDKYPAVEKFIQEKINHLSTIKSGNDDLKQKNIDSIVAKLNDLLETLRQSAKLNVSANLKPSI